MSFKKKEVAKNIFLLLFETQVELASTFLRFQEYYESPKFKNKIFTLKEFKKWYSSEKKSFTYYSDWHAFNVPSSALKPFYDGKFNPLSKKEKIILATFKDIKKEFYIIATHKKVKYLKGHLDHEMSHAFFYTDPPYRKTALEILSKFNLKKFKDRLKKTQGYSKEVLLDEIHAYSIDLDEKYSDLVPKKLHRELKQNYKTKL